MSNRRAFKLVVYSPTLSHPDESEACNGVLTIAVQGPVSAREFKGWTTGTPVDAEDTPRFAELSGVRPVIETYPLERAAEAFARMLSGKAQFRVVLTM